MTIAVSSVWMGERLVVRLRGLRGRSTLAPSGDLDPTLNIDYRIASVGGLLPDLIDKPLWWWFRPEQMTDSHAWAHTLLFSGSIILFGILLSLARFRWGVAIIVLGVGSFTHPLVDPIMFHRQTWFWPFMGTGFPSSPTPLGPLQVTLEQLLIAGMLMLGTSSLYRRRIWSFLVTGRIGSGEEEIGRRAGSPAPAFSAR